MNMKDYKMKDKMITKMAKKKIKREKKKIKMNNKKTKMNKKSIHWI